MLIKKLKKNLKNNFNWIYSKEYFGVFDLLMEECEILKSRVIFIRKALENERNNIVEFTEVCLDSVQLENVFLVASFIVFLNEINQN